MKDFLERNKRMLKFYHFTSRIAGWVLIGLTPMLSYILMLNRSSTVFKKTVISSYVFILCINKGIVSYLCLGIILLGISLLIKYIYSEETKPGWILDHFDKFFYLYAFLILIGMFIAYFNPEFHEGKASLQKVSSHLFPQMIINTAQIFILTGLGYIWKRVLPVIEESKTLV